MIFGLSAILCAIAMPIVLIYYFAYYRKRMKNNPPPPPKRILYTQLLDTYTTNSSASSAIGAGLFGTPGAVVGASDRKEYAMFRIVYEDKSYTTQKVEKGTQLYLNYIAKLRR